MSLPFLGEIKLFSCNFPPKGWAFCNGQILSIQQNTALFSLLGTTYGGNGQTTFALPDLRGRVPLHAGAGPGLSSFFLGERSGSENTNLIISQLPAHNHMMACNTSSGGQANPTNNYPGVPSSTAAGIYESTYNNTMAAGMLANTGGSQAHENRQPSLVLNYCIALTGIYPSRS